MNIKYFNDNRLKYTNRNRYKDISDITPFAIEEQRKILLGDGATTSIKTSVNNVCDYVEIDNTRWFVVNYTFLNGSQVQLNLQRDVVGEFGISDYYGKIERGHTDSILRNRKELDLNQVLKKRIPLKPTSRRFGNYIVDNGENEMYGILYFTRPNPSDTSININIPGFEPNLKSGTPPSTTEPYYEYWFRTITFEFVINFTGRFWNTTYNVTMYFNEDGTYTISKKKTTAKPNVQLDIIIASLEEENAVLNNIATHINNDLKNGVSNPIVNKPSSPTYTEDTSYKEFNNANVKIDNNFYEYNMRSEYLKNYGTTILTQDNGAFANYLRKFVGYIVVDNNAAGSTTGAGLSATSQEYYYKHTFTRRKLSTSESGTITINFNNNLVNEPYYVLAVPLFNTVIRNLSNTVLYNINKVEVMDMFNKIIESMSGGSNPYLVDAQIYPYCPNITGVADSLDNIPLFNISGTSFEVECNVNVQALDNVKKEYITREYSIVSPDQSDKFSFNFYDYKTANGNLKVVVKTALKPFAIISSAVVVPDNGSLMNITYGSDMRGCQPSSGGFQCSLSTNEFQKYKRENSNYQQIFDLQKEEMRKQHQVERVNEVTSGIVATAQASALGALAGANMADAGVLSLLGTKSAGAAIGASVSGGLVGGSMIAQGVANEGLRKYEESLQQQRFDLSIGTIKNLPNRINRISTFNDIILRDFYFVLEVYECTEVEKSIVDNYINNYGYILGIYDYFVNYYKQGWFLRGIILKSTLDMNLQNIANEEMKGGIYYYE